MLRILGIVAAALVVGVLGVLVFATTQPDEFHVERSAQIQAPPEKIFPHINEFRAWGAWSPWERLDPELKRTYSGPASGTGAAYAWVGNSDVGQGEMEIKESDPPHKVVIALRFIEPFEGRSTAEFTLQPAGDVTTVTWSMRGPNNFMGKLMGLFVNMDRMVGGDFESGLANLKALSES